MIDVQSRNGLGTFVVEAKTSFAPRDAERMLGDRVGQALRTISGAHLLVMSDWLSARTQALLQQRSINYLDLTGNAYIQTEYPTIFVRTTGAARNPTPTERGRARVRGPKAGRLIRMLIDVRPPYTVSELATATGLTAGYVSRLLAALEYEALVDRSATGAVTSVAVDPLLRRWTQDYDVTKSNEVLGFLATAGLAKTLERIAVADLDQAIIVSGSFAAVRLAPVAAPSLLMAYAGDPTAVGTSLGLLPASSGANVLLMRPFDEVVWQRTTTADRIVYAAPSQVVADCLTGPGRMPEEGEALMAWMADENRWRASDLSKATSGGGEPA